MWDLVIIILVALQRLYEMKLAGQNTKQLLSQGAKEYFPKHYILFVILHSTWLLVLFFYSLTYNLPIYIIPLIIYLIIQFLRFWTLKSLGSYWTTKIISLPGAPLVKSGPYKYIKHPNYIIAFLEILILPLVFGLWKISIIFSIIKLFLLIYRIKKEDSVLIKRRDLV